MTNPLADIEKLVAQVAKEAASAAMDINQKMDALKLLAPFYATMCKTRPGAEDGDGGPSMSDLRRDLRDVEETDAGVPPAVGRRRAGRPAPDR